MAIEHVDGLVAGARLSGISAGYHLQKHCPGKSYAILEGRDAIGRLLKYKEPWRLNQNYALDMMSLRYSRVEDGTLEFSVRAGEKQLPVQEA